MARKRRSYKNGAVVPVSADIALLTLGDNTVILSGDSPTLTQDMWVNAIDVYGEIRNMTPGEGPIEYGFADSTLTVAEILEHLDAQPTGPQDIPAVEHARRRVRSFGVIRGNIEDDLVGNGNKRRVKIKWLVPAGQQLPLFWARNRSGAALTTGAIALAKYKVFGNWK